MKTQKQKSKFKSGRKWFDGKNVNLVVSKLKRAWANGCKDCEAAIFAGISDKSLSRYLKAKPKLREEKEQLLNKPTLKARLNVVERIKKGNIGVSQWYLERKKKDEFSSRQEFTGRDGERLYNLSDAEKKKLDEILETNQ